MSSQLNFIATYYRDYPSVTSNKSNSKASAKQVNVNLQEQRSDHLHFRRDRTVVANK